MKEINYLKEHGTIELIAPSFGCVTEPYKTRLLYAIKNLKEDSFNVVEGENIYLALDKTRSNTPKKCAYEFNKAYLDPSIDVIISVGGGETMCEILPYVDFKTISKVKSKLFMGFSDNTNLTYTLTTIAEVYSIYGVNAGAFAFKPYVYSTKDSLDLLMGKTKKVEGYPYWEKEKFPEAKENPLCESNYSEIKKIITYPKKDELFFEGRLLGGCLDCLLNLCGTRFDKTRSYIEKYRDDGIIFFLESCELSPIDIERGLFQLKEAGWFKYVKGFIIGRPLDFDSKPFGVSHIEAFKKSLKKFNVPLLMDVDLGHFDPSMPIITGAKAKVTYKNKNIIIDYLDI